MIGTIEGRVSALRDDGFELAAGGAAPTNVKTLRSAEAMGLAVGDRVSVLGGPDGSGAWASSSVWRVNWDGSREEAPQHGTERLPAPPPKPWWRFW